MKIYVEGKANAFLGPKAYIHSPTKVYLRAEALKDVGDGENGSFAYKLECFCTIMKVEQRLKVLSLHLKQYLKRIQ
jgi:hypothetical protein